MIDEMVAILEEGQRTEKAVLCQVRIRSDGQEHEWETWISKSVIDEDGRDATPAESAHHQSTYDQQQDQSGQHHQFATDEGQPVARAPDQVARRPLGVLTAGKCCSQDDQQYPAQTHGRVQGNRDCAGQSHLFSDLLADGYRLLRQGANPDPKTLGSVYDRITREPRHHRWSNEYDGQQDADYPECQRTFPGQQPGPTR